MYQPKWTNDPDKLLKVARMDADAHHWDSSVFNIARELEAGGQPLAARRMRAEGLKRERAEAAAHPHDFVALAQYAWGLKGGERYGEAEAALRNLVKSFPRESALQDNYHEALATCLVEQKKTRDAIAEYQAAVKTHPRSAFILRELGYAYRQNHEPLKAIDVFHKAMRLDHGNANSWALLGDACLDARLPNQAIPAYQRSLQLDSRNAIAWRNLSKVFGLAGRYAEGIAAAQKALELDATDSETHGSLGYLYGQTKQPDRAAEECRLAVQYKPEDAISHNNLGEALRDLHQTAEARKEWELALRLDPNGPVGKNAREMLAKYP
jgi:tetratricopeptide (TPR) repeat protein